MFNFLLEVRKQNITKKLNVNLLIPTDTIMINIKLNYKKISSCNSKCNNYEISEIFYKLSFH